VLTTKGSDKRMGDRFAVDNIDWKIVELLRANGRATNQQIADMLDLTAATVSARIRRLEDANKLRVVAVSDFVAHGYKVLMQMVIEVKGRPPSEVAEELAAFPEVFASHLITGRYDIDLLVVLHEFDELSDLMSAKFANVRGIRSIMPAIALDVLKYHFDVAPIEAKE
jgi:Lrp/AsnC family leucine-responsive transcriptional regulator